MSSNFLSLNPSEPKLLIFDLPQKLSQLNNYNIHPPNNVDSPVDSGRNFCATFAVSRSWFLNIRDLRRNK